jgi:capsular exopolysaccharide synthesis family protein
MSRLFEALSDEELKRKFLKIAPRAVASPSAVPEDMIASTVTQEEGVQDVEHAQSVPAPGLSSGSQSETVSESTISSEAPPPISTKEIEKENWSPNGPPLNRKVSGIASPGRTVVGTAPSDSAHMGKQPWPEVSPNRVGHLEVGTVEVKVSLDSRLVAYSDPNGLGAEKFRALVTRLDHLRKQQEMKSLQVTSSVINEGKTLVAGNLAVTLAKYSGAMTLLIEGDLHRPSLAALFGLSELPGLSHWWSGNEMDLSEFVYKLNEMPLWILPAGKPCDLPSRILSSTRFAKALLQLASQFEWTVVDSTPMMPTVDANLWSRLVDGTLLVVREGIAPIKALKKGLQALDHPKLVGLVINESTSHDYIGYDDKYYGLRKTTAGRHEKM